MKKKHWKIIALALALILIAGLGWLANSLLGNPVSQALAVNTVRRHLEETYGGTDFYIERVGFSFKDTCYYAHIKSPSSIDTAFTLHIDMLGRLYLDTYESVTRGFNTARRIDTQYRELTKDVLDSLPFGTNIGYGTLEIHDAEDPEVPAYALHYDELEIDKEYSIPALGAAHGRVIVHIDSETVTVEEAVRLMLEIRQHFDEAGVPFRAMDFQLRYPLPDEGPRPEEFIGVKDFLYEDICEEGMLARVEAADEALKTYYAEMDKNR